MENSHDLCCIEEEDENGRKAMTSTSYPAGASDFRLFGRQGSVHDCFGGGQGEQRLNLYAFYQTWYEIFTFGSVFDLFSVL